MIKVFDVGDEGGKWFVAGVTNVDSARVEVIKNLGDQLLSAGSGGNDDFVDETRHALMANAKEYKFVVTDRETEKIYWGAPTTVNPYNAYSYGLEWFGFGVAIGFTIPEWDSKKVIDQISWMDGSVNSVRRPSEIQSFLSSEGTHYGYGYGPGSSMVFGTEHGDITVEFGQTIVKHSDGTFSVE